jgi:tetratricopeptide (TPR) repeat protein
LGDLLLWKARYQRNGESLRLLHEADTTLKKAIEVSPRNPGILANLGRVDAVRIELALRDNSNLDLSVARGETTLAKALAMDPRNPFSLQYLGELRSAAVRWNVYHGGTDQMHFDMAAESFKKGLEIAPNNLEIQIALARMYRDQAEWERVKGKDHGQSLAQGRILITQILAARPKWGEALAIQGGLKLEEAERLPVSGRRSMALEAVQAFNQAFQFNKNIIEYWRPSFDRASRITKTSN